MNLISGIQQVGVGVKKVYEALDWYHKHLGFNTPVIDDAGTAELMLPYTAGKPQKRHAVMAYNLQGGGGLEIWQYVDRTPSPPAFDLHLGDLGIHMTKIKSKDVKALYDRLKKENVAVLGDLKKSPDGRSVLYFSDPYGNLFQAVETEEVFKKTKYKNGGVFGAVIGVSDMEASVAFYRDVLGYDRILYDRTEAFDDYKEIPGGAWILRRVLLTHSNKRPGPFSRLFGKSEIELIRSEERKGEKIFKDRLWGDLGFIHLCFDVLDMNALKEKCEKAGFPFTVDSGAGQKGIWMFCKSWAYCREIFELLATFMK
jgi:catechol 2,3-dioxygenase-like lactoylglutathione lyase family enzyme